MPSNSYDRFLQSTSFTRLFAQAIKDNPFPIINASLQFCRAFDNSWLLHSNDTAAQLALTTFYTCLAHSLKGQAHPSNSEPAEERAIGASARHLSASVMGVAAGLTLSSITYGIGKAADDPHLGLLGSSDTNDLNQALFTDGQQQTAELWSYFFYPTTAFISTALSAFLNNIQRAQEHSVTFADRNQAKQSAKNCLKFLCNWASECLLTTACGYGISQSLKHSGNFLRPIVYKGSRYQDNITEMAQGTWFAYNAFAKGVKSCLETTQNNYPSGHALFSFLPWALIRRTPQQEQSNCLKYTSNTLKALFALAALATYAFREASNCHSNSALISGGLLAVVSASIAMYTTDLLADCLYNDSTTHRYESEALFEGPRLADPHNQGNPLAQPLCINDTCQPNDIESPPPDLSKQVGEHSDNDKSMRSPSSTSSVATSPVTTRTSSSSEEEQTHSWSTYLSDVYYQLHGQAQRALCPSRPN